METLPSHQRPSHSRVRFRILGVTTLAAVLLYLDRVCLAEIIKLDEFRSVLGLTEEDKGAIFASFFFTYALAQVPAGWLADRFGARMMLPLYITIWSLCTFAMGLATTFVMFLIVRLLFGLAQAGCYPSASSLIKRWTPTWQRGTASAIVSFGGRLGGAAAPLLTAWLLQEYLGWRAVLMLYGASGLLVAVLFYREFRDFPHEHPDCSEQERRLIRGDDAAESNQQRPAFPPIWPLICSGTMWLMCVLQFGINIGWVYLITWLPTYLKEVRHVDPTEGGFMSSLVLLAGIVGMLCGGPLTDFCTARWGQRWGRSLPVTGCYAAAAAAHLSCLWLESAWSFVAAAAVVAFMTDLSVPALWAYIQDVGGRNTASAFGWGNMWGNLGAATTALLIPRILSRWDLNGDWHEVFLVMAAGFVVAGVSALGLNPERRITSE